MNRYINFVLERPRVVIAFLLIATALLGAGIPRLGFDNSIEVMMPQQDPEYIRYEKVKDIYGNIGKYIVINLTSDKIWSEDFFVQADAFVSDLEEFKTYDEARETERLARLGAAAGHEQIRDRVLALFEGDAPFRRALARSMDGLYRGETHYTPRMMAAVLREMSRIRDIKKMQIITTIFSPLTAKDISGRDDTLRGVEIIPVDENGKRMLPRTEKEMEEFRQRLCKNPAFEGGLYARNRQSGEITDFCVLINLANIKKTEDVITREIWNITSSYKTISLIAHGYPIVHKVMNDYMRNDLETFLPLVLLVVAFVFFLNFGSATGVILPFMTLVMADVWTLGLMGHMGKNLTIIGISLPTLLVAVGSSYSIHIMNQYYLDFDSIKKAGKLKGLGLSMMHISTTVFLAGLTTFLGFISLMTNQVVGIREWGLFSAIGVFFAVLIATSLIPAVLVLVPQRRARQKSLLEKIQSSATIDAFIRGVTKLSVNHHRAVIAVLFAVLIASFAGIFRLKVETAFMSFYKEHDPVRVNSRLLGEKYGGSAGISILIDSGKAMGIYDPGFLRTVDEVRAWLTDKKNSDLSVGRTDAFPDVIKTMNMAVNNDDPAYYRIPDREVDVLDFMEIYAGEDADSDGRIDDFKPFIDREHRTVMIFAKIWEGYREYHSTSDLVYIQDRIDRHLRETLPPGCTHTISGEPAILVKLADYITTGQIMSLVFSLATVSLIIVLLFKNWKAGLVAMIPMSTAVAVNFGIMGWTGIRLDSATAIIASITIGIGVDDTIHFLNTFRHFKKQNLGVDETITRILAHAGKAIIYTSVALVMGFSILVFSNFRPIILFGVLSSLTMIITTAGALVLLPSVIKATGMDLQESDSDSLFWRIFHIGRYFNIDEAPGAELSED